MGTLWILILIFGSVSAADDNLEPDRVVEGVLINITEAPWTVSMHSLIWRDGSWDVTKFMCAGAIIGKNEILTAAHCISKDVPPWKTIIFRAGSANREKGSLHDLDYVRHHPKLQPGDASYDFAFVRVKQPFEFSDTIKPIKIQKTELKSGTTVFLAGWGTTDPKWEPEQLSSKYLRAVNMTMWDKDDCYKNFNVSVCFANYPELLKCMKNIGEGSGKSACRGDSGSPIIYNGKLAGVLTGGASSKEISNADMICNDPNVVNVYNTPVTIRRWLKQMIQESQGIGKRR